MLAGSFSTGAVRALQLSQFFFQRRLQPVELAQFFIEGINLTGQLALLFFQAIDTLVVGLFELVELLAKGFSDVFDIFLFNSHERLLKCESKVI